MARLRDPIEFAAGEERDLQGIATWEPRSLVDRLLARYISSTIRAAIVLFGLLIFVGVLALLAFQVYRNPRSLLVLILFPISVIPAAILFGYVWYSDITSEPILMLIATYLLGIVLASFPYLINTAVGLLLRPLVAIPILGFFVEALNFYLVVAPIEEAVKLGAVFMFVYWRDDFDTVIDGAVYGAVAGLGFATIENVSYIVGQLAQTQSIPGLIVAGSLITVVRSFAGPGHVIWTALAGYYLGLAKFNRPYALPLVVKGLFVAAFIHGTYNTLSSAIGGVLGLFGTVGLLVSIPVTFGFIFVFHTVVFAYLFVRLRRYRKTYAEVSPGDHAADVSKLEGYERMREAANDDEGSAPAGDAGNGPATDPNAGARSTPLDRDTGWDQGDGTSGRDDASDRDDR